MANEKRNSKNVFSLLLKILVALVLLALIICVVKTCVDCRNYNTNPSDEGGITPVQNPCDTQQAAGGDEGYLGYFDMGQKGGEFPFSFDTYTVPDRITIYDGKGTGGRVIYSYEGGSDGVVDVEVKFSQKFVTVKIERMGEGTSWDFNIGCPNN